MTRSLLIAQSGGATAATNSTLAGILDHAGVSEVFDRVVGSRYGLNGLLSKSFVDLSRWNRDRIAGLARTPGAALGTGRRRLSDEDVSSCLDILTREKFDSLIVIGGNDSADSIDRLHRVATDSGRSFNLILAPKTIDNDLMETDHCPGFGSAARFLGNFVRDITFDSLSAPQLYPAKLIEVGGRDAGWLTAAAALGFSAGERDLCPLLIFPERPPDTIDVLVDLIEQRIRDIGWVVSVIPETLRSSDGLHLSGSGVEQLDPFGHPYHRSAAVSVAEQLRDSTGVRARIVRPGSATRSSYSLASDVDLAEAFRLGDAACRAVAQGQSGNMVMLRREIDLPYRCAIGSVVVNVVANRVRLLPDTHLGADGHSVSKAFLEYALPLTGEAAYPPYERIA